jgi:hypothetical protein
MNCDCENIFLHAEKKIPAIGNRYYYLINEACSNCPFHRRRLIDELAARQKKQLLENIASGDLSKLMYDQACTFAKQYPRSGKKVLNLLLAAPCKCRDLISQTALTLATAKDTSSVLQQLREKFCWRHDGILAAVKTNVSRRDLAKNIILLI